MVLAGTVGALTANMASGGILSLPTLKKDLAVLAALYRKMGHPKRADLYDDIAAMIDDMAMAYANQHRAEISL